MKKQTIETHNHIQNGVERVVRAVNLKSSCFLESFNCDVELMFFRVSRVDVASLD